MGLGEFRQFSTISVSLLYSYILFIYYDDDDFWICCTALVDGCCRVVLSQFFEKAAENVKENVGDDVQTDQLIKEACRNVLEHVSPPRCPPIVHSANVILMSCM